MTLVLNGNTRDFPDLPAEATLQHLIDDLQLKGDRIAVEHNGTIVSRTSWPTTPLAANDKLEVVHFVGGGTGPNTSLS